MGTTARIALSVTGLLGQGNKQHQTPFMDARDSQGMHETAHDMSLLSDDTLLNDNKIPRASLGYYARGPDDHIE